MPEAMPGADYRYPVLIVAESMCRRAAGYGVRKALNQENASAASEAETASINHITTGSRLLRSCQRSQ